MKKFNNISSANLPTKYGDFKIYGFENEEKSEHHVALTMGDVFNSKTPVLIRIHSECLTGDAFGSNKCECGDQLDFALKKIAQNKKGILLYLRQEGRGIGLINKIKAYNLQDQGLDTVEANLKLGFLSDMRDYSVAAEMLNFFNVKSVDLMTNNPEKIKGLEKYNIVVSNRTPIEIEHKTTCNFYMQTKKDKMGHILKKI